MENVATVRIMSSEIQQFKNIEFGEIKYMNYSSIQNNARIENSDIVGLYGQNGSGKTALVEALDILKYILCCNEIPYNVYAGILPQKASSKISTTFFVDLSESKYKVLYEAIIRANQKTNKIELFQEKLIYWERGATWKNEKNIQFENIFYNVNDIIEDKTVEVKSNRLSINNEIKFFNSMQSLAIFCSQAGISVFFNHLISEKLSKLSDSKEAKILCNIIRALTKFGNADFHIIKVNQHGAINDNMLIPLNMRCETESSVVYGCLPMFINGQIELPLEIYDLFSSIIEAINIAIKSLIPNLQIDIEEKNKEKKTDGKDYIKLEIYSCRDNNRFLIKYESEGIKRIVSLLNYLISVYNSENVCLVVDELDSGVFEYLLGELLGMLYKEMKGQLIFTSHNLRILEKLGSNNIICSTTNPQNRYIRLKGIEKNHNKRDFYIRAITVGGQKEELYDEDDLLAMSYAFRKAGRKYKDSINIPFSDDFLKIKEEEDKK